jgi:hypothetical protein
LFGFSGDGVLHCVAFDLTPYMVETWIPADASMLQDSSDLGVFSSSLTTAIARVTKMTEAGVMGLNVFAGSLRVNMVFASISLRETAHASFARCDICCYALGEVWCPTLLDASEACNRTGGCSGSPCQNSGVCVPGPGSEFTCVCPPAFPYGPVCAATAASGTVVVTHSGLSVAVVGAAAGGCVLLIVLVLLFVRRRNSRQQLQNSVKPVINELFFDHAAAGIFPGRRASSHSTLNGAQSSTGRSLSVRNARTTNADGDDLDNNFLNHDEYTTVDDAHDDMYDFIPAFSSALYDDSNPGTNDAYMYTDGVRSDDPTYVQFKNSQASARGTPYLDVAARPQASKSSYTDVAPHPRAGKDGYTDVAPFPRSNHGGDYVDVDARMNEADYVDVAVSSLSKQKSKQQQQQQRPGAHGMAKGGNAGDYVDVDARMSDADYVDVAVSSLLKQQQSAYATAKDANGGDYVDMAGKEADYVDVAVSASKNAAQKSAYALAKEAGGDYFMPDMAAQQEGVYFHVDTATDIYFQVAGPASTSEVAKVPKGSGPAAVSLHDDEEAGYGFGDE